MKNNKSKKNNYQGQSKIFLTALEIDLRSSSIKIPTLFISFICRKRFGRKGVMANPRAVRKYSLYKRSTRETNRPRDRAQLHATATVWNPLHGDICMGLWRNSWGGASFAGILTILIKSVEQWDAWRRNIDHRSSTDLIQNLRQYLNFTQKFTHSLFIQNNHFSSDLSRLSNFVMSTRSIDWYVWLLCNIIK